MDAKGVEGASAARPRTANKKSAVANIAFSEIDDLFISTKGKKLRNLQKKLDKIKEQEKLLKGGQIQTNPDLEKKLASKPEIQAEIKELNELIDLYKKSNPDYDKKNQAPKLTQEDVNKAVADALTQVARVASLAALLTEDSTFVELADGERTSFASLAQTLNGLAGLGGSQSFVERTQSDFVSKFAALA